MYSGVVGEGIAKLYGYIDQRKKYAYICDVAKVMMSAHFLNLVGSVSII